MSRQPRLTTLISFCRRHVAACAFAILAIISTYTFLMLAAHERTGSKDIVTLPHVENSTADVEKFPELKWLMDDEGTIKSYRRALASLECFRCLLNGHYEDYLGFIAHQPKGKKLSWSSFTAIQKNLQSVVNHASFSPETMQLGIETMLVLTEVIHSLPVHAFLQQASIKAGCCWDIVDAIVHQDPLFFPSIRRLPKEMISWIKTIASFNHFEKLLRLEGGPELLQQLKASDVFNHSQNIYDLKFALFTIEFAPIVYDESKLYSDGLTEPIYESIESLKEACLLLKTKGADTAYTYYLETRAKWLGFDPGSPLNRVLTRIGSMMMLFSPEEGRVLKDAILKLVPEDLAVVVEEFSEGKKEPNYQFPTALPSVLVNLSHNHNLGVRYQERLEQTISIGVPFIAKALRLFKEQNKTHDSGQLHFDEAALIAHDRPINLSTKSFVIDDRGHIVIHD